MLLRLTQAVGRDGEHVNLSGGRRLDLGHRKVRLALLRLEAARTFGAHRAASVARIRVFVTLFRLLDLGGQVREPLVTPGRGLVLVREATFALVIAVGSATVL